MTDPDAVREYEEAAVKLGYAYPEVEDLNALADAAIAALRDFADELKCCPNCGHLWEYNAGTEDEFKECHLVRDIPERETRDDWGYMDGSCYFTPSRWEQR